MSQIAYIDASAFVKLFAREPESEAVAAAMDGEWRHLVASEILTVEVLRAAARIGGGAPAAASWLLRRVVLLPFAPEIRERASQVGTVRLRTLDAIHLATALSPGAQTAAIFTYDRRLAEAGEDAGLRVLAPAPA